MTEQCLKSAVLSDCQKFRYRLERTWDAALRPMCFVMCNPSVADHEIDDPTIKSCCRIARHNQVGGIVVVNCYGFRATDPRDLKKAGYPVGPDNDRHMREAVQSCHPVVVAWGANVTAERAWQVKKLLKAWGVAPVSLAVTKGGQPAHPLFIPASRQLIQFPL